MSFPNLPSREICTGCGGCRNVCPFNAISMYEDEEGFLQPRIDLEDCKKCGKCESVCPLLHLGRKRPPQITDKSAICGLIRDEGIWRESSSGGAFSAICQVYADGGASIYGARYEGLSRVVHSRANGVSEMGVFRKSKYVQSETRLIFSDVKRDLESGRAVVFSGTPCQVAGLREFLGADYDGLLCVEFICHGVGSPKVFREWLAELECGYKRKLESYCFRSKDNRSFGSAYASTYVFADGSRKSSEYDAYNRIFIKQLCLRRSCMENCKFRVSDRYADITIADSRRERELHPEIADDKNRSVIVANTDKGAELVSRLKERMDLLPYDMDMLQRTNPLYFGTTKGNPLRNEFFKAYLGGVRLARLADRYDPAHSTGLKALIFKVRRRLFKLFENRCGEKL